MLMIIIEIGAKVDKYFSDSIPISSREFEIRLAFGNSIQKATSRRFTIQ